MADANRGWFAVAGPELTLDQFHCAIVGAREAVEGVADINAAHWKAVRAGERGYRLPDSPVPMVPWPGIIVTFESKDLSHRPDLAIPDDLSIPAFLDRRPLPFAEAA